MIATDADNDVVDIPLDDTDKCISVNDDLYFKIESNNLVFFSPSDYEYVQIDGNKKLSFSVQLLLDDGAHVICKEVLLEITDVLLAKPALTVNYYVKELVLSWNEDLEATEFTLIRRLTGNINPEEVIAQLSPAVLEYRLKIPSSHFEDWVNTSYKLIACQNNTCLSSQIVKAQDIHKFTNII